MESNGPAIAIHSKGPSVYSILEKLYTSLTAFPAIPAKIV